jgi:hypothetical protein
MRASRAWRLAVVVALTCTACWPSFPPWPQDADASIDVTADNVAAPDARPDGDDVVADVGTDANDVVGDVRDGGGDADMEN